MIFDSHCHLNDKQLHPIIDEVIASANKEGVTHFLVVGWDVESSKLAIELAEKYNNVYAAVGIHPTDVKDNIEEELVKLEKLLTHPKVKALGEIGLDYYWIKDEHLRNRQKKYFIKQIQLADKYNLPIVVHNRDSIADCVDIIKNNTPQNKGVIHCFSGSVEIAKEFIKLGFYISLGGPVTFKNARVPKEVAANIPLTSLLVETDCPYLTPHPFRGQRNEPKYTSLVIEEIANLRNTDKDTIIRQTFINTMELLKIKYED